MQGRPLAKTKTQAMGKLYRFGLISFDRTLNDLLLLLIFGNSHPSLAVIAKI
jgi:hypothetical protein